MWLKNAWYVAGHAAEIVPGKLMARRLLNQPVVLWRTDAGQAVAFRDRCPHRLVPLSMGRHDGDAIVCGYHGMRFGADGMCNHIPAQEQIPQKARATAYPLVERHALLWIWMGDAAQADAALIPDLHWMQSSDWVPSEGYLHIAADYRLVTDNLLDLSHESFIHTRTIGDDVVAQTPVRSDVVNEHVVRAHREMPNIEAPPFFARLMGDPEARIDRFQTALFHPPGLNITFVKIRPAGATNQSFDGRATHMLTPETERSTHYFWAFARNFVLDDAELTNYVRQATAATFDEDKAMLEAQQLGIEEEPETPLPQLALRVDGAPMQARRLLGKLVSQERLGHVMRTAELQHA